VPVSIPSPGLGWTRGRQKRAHRGQVHRGFHLGVKRRIVVDKARWGGCASLRGTTRMSFSAATTIERYRKFLNPSLVRLMKFAGYDAVETTAEGVYVYDDRGRRFLDCAGG